MATLSIETSSAVVESRSNYLEFIVSLSEPAIDAVSIGYRTRLAGTALNADLYRNAAHSDNNGRITFEPGQTTKSLFIRTDGDSIDERDEHIALELFDPVGASLAGNHAVLRTTGVILDNDGAGSNLALFTSDPILIEGDSGQRNAVFEVRLSRPAPEAFTANYTTVDGSATAGEDYTAVSGTLSFSAGQSVKTIEVPVLGDGVSEPMEQFSLVVTPPETLSIGIAGATGEATILDNDAASGPTISIEAADAVVESRSHYLRFVVTLSEPGFDAISVNYRTRLAGTALDSDLYRTATHSDNNGTLTFEPGQTSKSLFIRTDGDSIDERDEHIALELFDPVGGSLAGDLPVLRATGVILDNDGAGSNLALFTSDPVLIEGDSGQQLAQFEVRLSQPAPTDITFSYQTVDVTATAGSDYIATSGTLSFATGQEVAAVMVPVLGDTSSELTEGFLLSVSGPDDLSVETAGATGEATILDDDAASGPTISIEAADAVVESRSHYLRFVVTLSEPGFDAISVNYRTRLAGTALDSDLYRTATHSDNNGTLTFEPGQTSKSLFIRTDGDSNDERDEHIALELFDPVGGSLAGDLPVLRATGVILDNDGAGSNLALFTSDPVLIEGDSGQQLAQFEVRLSQPAPTDITFSYQTVDVTATAGSDYIATSGTLTFLKDQQVASVAVPVLGDLVSERNEIFSLIIEPPEGVSIGTDGAVGNATIIDNDASGPTVSVEAADAVVESRSHYLRFVVTLSEPSGQPVTVDYNTQPGTAQGADLYSSDNSGTLVFEPGKTTKSIFIRTDGDSLDERDETIFLNLSNVTGATFTGGLSTQRAIGVILDNDGVGLNQMLVFADEVIAEPGSGAQIVNVPVMLSRPGSQELVYNVTAVEQTAEQGTDFELDDTTVTFAPGQTLASVPIRVFGDDNNEDTETSTLQYTPAPGMPALEPDVTQTVTILNAENGGVDTEAPVITAGQLFDVAENTAMGTLVGTVLATDNLEVTSFGIIAGNVDVDSDGDLPFVIDSNGVITITDSDDLVDDGANDPFTLTIEVSDAAGNSASDEIVVNVEDVENVPPVATDDSGTTEVNTAVTLSVLANDSDPDGDTFFLAGVDDPANGTAAINNDGTITYTPDTGFTGEDSFTYSVTDDNGATNAATVIVTVEGPTPPIEPQPSGEPTAYYTFTDATPTEFFLATGLNAELLGATAGKTLNLSTGAIARGIDAATTVNVPGASADYLLQRDGTTLRVFDSTGAPVTSLSASSTETSSLRFSDGAADLTFEGGNLVIGDTTLSDEESIAGGTLSLDATTTSSGVFTGVSDLAGSAEATAFLILTDTTPVTFTLGAGLVVELLGNSAGKAINIPQGAGADGVDPNTTLYIEGASSTFTFSRNGTTLEVHDEAGHLTASLNASTTETSTLVFADGFLELAVADNQLILGGTTFTAGLSVSGAELTVDPGETSEGRFGAVIDLDALGGTAQNPASAEAGDDALTFADSVAFASHTEISDFGADDRLVFQGVDAAAVEVNVADGATNFAFDDGAGAVSQIVLLGVTGPFTSVAEFNADTTLGDVSFA